MKVARIAAENSATSRMRVGLKRFESGCEAIPKV
jgi:hypothetical protein